MRHADSNSTGTIPVFCVPVDNWPAQVTNQAFCCDGPVENRWNVGG